MGVLDRFRKSDAEFLVASARRIDERDKTRAERPMRKEEKWQDEAWEFYDTIPHLWFAFNYLGNVMRRARIFPAVQPDPMQPPVPLRPEDGLLFSRAQAELDRLRGPDGTHGELLHDMTMQLSVPGEGWLHGHEEDGVERFDVRSNKELRYDKNETKWKLYTGPDDRTGTSVGDGDYVARFWRQHPKWGEFPDSGMRAANTSCRELLDIQKYMAGTTKSRMNAGLLLVPSEATFRRADAQTGDAQGQAQARDPFLNMLMTALMTPIQDQDSASVVVPGLVKMKKDLIPNVRHLTFAREYDRIAAAREEMLLTRIATSVDMPNDFVLGMADLPHWTAWFVDQDKFDAHLAPLLQLICAGITEAFLNAALGDMPDERVIAWYDGSAIVSHPNRSSDADGAYDRMTISNAAYRRYKGYTEDDAPTEEEVEERIRIEREKKATAPGVTDDGGAPAGVNDTEPGPASDETNPENIVGAAPRDEMHDLGLALREIDYRLRLQVQGAAQGVVFRALERAGAKMRRRVGNHAVYGTLIADVPQHQVCNVLGRDVVAQYLQTEDEIIDDAVSPITAVFIGWVARAQSRVRELAAEHGEVDQSFSTQQAQDRDAGLEVLKTGLAATVAALLFSADATPDVAGEFEDSTLVTPGLVRSSLVRAGGGDPTKVLNEVTGEPQGQVATGRTALDIFDSVLLTPEAWVWTYGDASTRSNPFLGHRALNGVEFLDWTDERLRIRDGDAWLGVGYYHPGDHQWCQCDFAPVFKSKED